MRSKLCLLSFIALSFSAQAKDRFPPKEAKSAVDSALAETRSAEQQMSAVVVTGQFEATSTDRAVHKIRVIDRKKIDAMSAQNLRDVLSNELNIRLGQDNILGSSMSLQGMSGENIKILIDGIPVIGRQDGNIDLSQINLNNIEHIEIVEGPMCVNFGTNALAGTINLITKKQLQRKWEAGLNTYYETIGTYNANARLGYSDKHSTVLVSGGRNFFDGWSDSEKIALDNKPQLADSRRYQQWKPKEQYFADLQYIYRFKNISFNYKGSYFREEIINRGMPRAPYKENALDDAYRTYRTDNGIFMNTKLNKGKNIDVFVAYNNYQRIKNTYYRDLTTLRSSLTDNLGDQDTSRFTSLTSRGSFNCSNASHRISYQLGYDIDIEQVFGIRIKDEKQRIDDYALFSSAEVKLIEGLTVRPGLRFAYNTKYDAPLVPSLNVRYKIGSGITLRASYAKGFRAPTLKELYFYFVDVNHNIQGNPDLKAENSDNYALNAGYVKFINTNVLKLDAGFYYNGIRNMISLAQTSANAEYSYINVGIFKTMGYQLMADYKMGALTLSLGGIYTGRYNDVGAGAPKYSYSPEVRGNVTYEFIKAATTVCLFTKYTGSTPGYAVDGAGKVSVTRIDDYSIMDATVTKTFSQKRFNIGVGCKNIFDVKNVNIYNSLSSTMPFGTGRNYFLKLDIKLYAN